MTQRMMWAVIGAGACCGSLWAQSTGPAVFVANNGNLEGSVSSMLVNPDGTLTFRDKYITGTRPNTTVFHPGTNAQTISISPNGKYLAAGHGTSSNTVEQLTILRVAADGGLSLAGIFSTPDSPLDVLWLRDDTLAATATGNSPNGVYVYRFNENGGGPGVPTLQQIDFEQTGSFTSSLAKGPFNFLYANNSSGSTIHPFQIESNGTLTQLPVYSAPALPLGLGASQGPNPDKQWVYAGGGISSGGRAIVGARLTLAGTLQPIDGSPFTSGGNAPKQVVVSPDTSLAFVAHGSESSVRSFTIDPATGALTATGFVRVVGIQGSLGEIGVMRNWLFACDRDTINDGVRGLMSFTVMPNGSFPQNGTTVDTLGITPNELAVWRGLCVGDVTGDLVVNFADLNVVLSQFGQTGVGLQGDVNGDGVVNFGDLNIILSNFGTVC
ncbi:MAG: hypothetical protein AB7G17_00550 [Phycisphaerales bacterium]